MTLETNVDTQDEADEVPQDAKSRMARADRIAGLAAHTRMTRFLTIFALLLLLGRSFVPQPDFVPLPPEERTAQLVLDLALYLGVSVITLLAIGAQMVSVAAWTMRARANAYNIGAREMVWSRAWGGASWFIPVANLVLPFLVLAEIWKASHPSAHPPHGWLAISLPKRFGVWWGAWILGVSLFVFTEIGVVVANLVERISGLAQIELRLVTQIFLLIGGAFWLWFSKAVTRHQEIWASRIAPRDEIVPARKRWWQS